MKINKKMIITFFDFSLSLINKNINFKNNKNDELNYIFNRMAWLV